MRAIFYSILLLIIFEVKNELIRWCKTIKIEFLRVTFVYQFDLNNPIVINGCINVDYYICRIDVNRNKVLHLRRQKMQRERKLMVCKTVWPKNNNQYIYSNMVYSTSFLFINQYIRCIQISPFLKVKSIILWNYSYLVVHPFY